MKSPILIKRYQKTVEDGSECNRRVKPAPRRNGFLGEIKDVAHWLNRSLRIK